MIEIKRQEETIFTLDGYGEGSIVSCQLMEHHYVLLKFSTEEPVYFKIGDSVELEMFGKFELTEDYFPTVNSTTGGYDYELQLDAYYWKWQNKICKYRPKYGANETSFTLTASIEKHVQIILDNLAALGYTYHGKAFVADVTTYNNEVFDVDKAINLSYDSISIIDALNALCSEDAYDCEWWVDGNVVYFGHCEMTGQTTFRLGDNMFSMSQSDSKDTYATRLYVFGSDRNIPKGYFTGQDADVTVNGVASDYLMLPEMEADTNGFVSRKGYIENTNVVTSEEQAVEGVVLFEDEYPKVSCTVNSIKTYESTVENDDGTTTTQTFYQITDTGSNFAKSFTKSWIKSGLTLSMKFESGSLNGMEFEVAFKIIDGVNYFEIVANDEYGRTLPDPALCPKNGDKFFLYNWDATKIAETSLISEAQQSLYKRGIEYYKKSMIDPSNFTCVMDAIQFYNHGTADYHPLGEQVKLIHPMFADVDEDGNHYRNSRIIGFEIKLDIPWDEPQYTVGEKASYSRLGQLEETVNSITVNGKSLSGVGVSGSSVYVIGTNDTTTPTDSNVYSARRVRLSYLNKTTEDIAQELITFLKGMAVGENYGIDNKGQATLDNVHNFGSSALDRVLIGGSGYEMYVDAQGKSHLWVDELMVRVKAYFASLEIRKVSYSGGTTLFSNAGSTLVKVVPIENGGAVVTFKCYAIADDGTMQTRNWWKVGDQALCQTFNIKEGVYKDVANTYYWRLVVDAGQEVLEDGKTYDFVTLSNVKSFTGDADVIPKRTVTALGLTDGGEVKALSWAGSVLGVGRSDMGSLGVDGSFVGYDDGSDEPKAGDVIVQAGSQTEAAARGNVIVLATSTDDGGVDSDNAPCIRMYHGISSYKWTGLTAIISPEKVKFSTKRFELFSADDGSDSAPMTVYMGEWDAATQYGYYQQVTYGGQIWTWLNASEDPVVGVAPDTDGSGWTLTVSKGEDGVIGQDAVQVVILTTKGVTLRPGLTDTTMEAHVYKGGEEVTDTIEPSAFTWIRTSADEASDTLWNKQHTGCGNTVTVTKNEVFRRVLFECQVDTTRIYENN